ncbi:MAG TPA: phosphoglycerate dehydrogenase [Algoriphagus sp.]|jgi:D-3-phosphoglycerate dehydrogenase|uniref:2-hydroxyacid dehydrogenase n=1 Tax=unclassified Algoriphagus TaxID=2641541 RepID=UPI000C615EF5|nr:MULTISPECIES: hydroxyacid dehydrogenase [unclassified Algoriphagus]MAL12754.1 phosphoglycerate dehydrogenase [Algoriphagus sp.]QYH39557.1 hydroxyacid dehydrogenase [Algoriphagus sp. NBT04N3]HAH38746.1 phosphoglycerate dehydrogenase [Algoriphagus sp.]HAS56912.1 phosphoglycerate dehydrogenase [Algoriphagus sp.]HCB45207.1 phosphoglycerate dehydrogenase [Algoriphagus sp.]|tara:strand:- start:1211 stop:2173 length:963 start_codon:yes stop_codon:yes gene_type:complete
MKPVILLLETVAEEAMKILLDTKEFETVLALDEKSLQEAIGNGNVSAIITRGKGQVRAELMDQLPQLQIIARCGVGLDNIDVEEATRRKIKVVNAPNSNANTIAEHTIALMLNLQRKLYSAFTMVKEGRWNDRGTYAGDELNGKTLGILGMGNIGKKVARIADALGMQVCYWSAEKEDVPYPMLSFEEVLKNSDVLSLHLPLTPQTSNLINAEAIGKMKEGALLINTARGPIIDQKALNDALESGKLGGFAADVLTEEPPSQNEPLISLPNTLITAHVGSLTKSTYTQMCVMTVNNTLSILKGMEPTKNCIFNRAQLELT